MKRYREYKTYLGEIFGERVQKISIDAGFSCPNRDGTISGKGCIYCDSRGSGTGAMLHKGLSIDEQIEKGKKFAAQRYNAGKFIAYFQSFTNTYAPVSELEALYTQALGHEGMVGLSVGTRPDCVDKEILDLISSYRTDYLVWIEFGLQSAHNITLERINRGHDTACFERSAEMADNYGLNVCAHVILGLPGETRDMMLDTARFIGRLPVAGIKIHMLYVLKGTPLAEAYDRGEFRCMEREEYVDTVLEFLELIPGEVVVQRLTGDPVHSELLDPIWAGGKNKTLNLINELQEKRDTWQGKMYRNSIAGV